MKRISATELDKRREARNHTGIKFNTTRTEVMKAVREDQKWERRCREADQWAQTKTRRMLRHYKEEATRKARLKEQQAYESQMSQVTDASEYADAPDLVWADEKSNIDPNPHEVHEPLLMGEDLLNQEDHHAIIEARDIILLIQTVKHHTFNVEDINDAEPCATKENVPEQ